MNLRHRRKVGKPDLLLSWTVVSVVSVSNSSSQLTHSSIRRQGSQIAATTTLQVQSLALLVLSLDQNDLTVPSLMLVMDVYNTTSHLTRSETMERKRNIPE